jgi:hypothetical protein
VSSLILGVNLGETRRELSKKLSSSADTQASEKLQLQATATARAITEFLQSCEQDLHVVTALPRDITTLKAFYDSRRSQIWLRDPDNPANEQGVIKNIPLYRTLALVDARGRETFAIDRGIILPPAKLRDVSRPENTEFLSENYFNVAKKLHRGQIHVTHVTGFHVTKTEQLGDSADPEHTASGKEYEGVVRFSTPLFDEQGKFTGVMVLSLDHRHLMEFSQHIQPGTGNPILFPSYKSGNYAFIFDDEGWIITHPKY